ncbi:MAG: T9SS type A sorting domain-containing protein [[Clostridium] fimetarium]|nr:T9SS type A sorting domain-containing protein [Alistipes timonensis]MCM1406381.1 T9SS type A sorting domain-containing protein [[Clostridium] fimetarium]
MYRFLISVGVALAGFLCCQAADVAQVTVNGEPVRKAVTEISFDGDQLTIHFADSDRMDADMGNVSLSFVDDGTSAVGNIAGAMDVFCYDGIVGDVLTVRGLSENSTLAIHDVAGKTVLGPVAAKSEMKINVSSLRPGVYVLRAGKNVVKFTKH